MQIIANDANLITSGIPKQGLRVLPIAGKPERLGFGN